MYHERLSMPWRVQRTTECISCQYRLIVLKNMILGTVDQWRNVLNLFLS